MKVNLVWSGSYHDVDSNEMAFKIAGSMGFKEGFRRAHPVLLEPIMKVEVVTPEEYSGDVIGDLNRRRGQITGMEESAAGKAILADVPLARDVRLRHQRALHEPGPGDVHDGVFQVRRSAAERRRLNYHVLISRCQRGHRHVERKI